MAEPMTTESNPADFSGDVVNAYLADASQEERARVLEAEAAEGGKARKGVLGGPYGTGQVEAGGDQVGTDDGDGEKPDTQPTGQGTVHQKGAPKVLTDAADKAAAKGYIVGDPALQPKTRRDYTQQNPSVMKGRA